MFKVGDRVLCIDDSGHMMSQTHERSALRKGREYIIYGIIECTCGTISFDIGLTLPSDSSDIMTCMCGRDRKIPERTWYALSKRFVKISEVKEVQYVKLEVEIEEPCLN
jgi:hypothetical protein